MFEYYFFPGFWPCCIHFLLLSCERISMNMMTPKFGELLKINNSNTGVRVSVMMYIFSKYWNYWRHENFQSLFIVFKCEPSSADGSLEIFCSVVNKIFCLRVFCSTAIIRIFVDSAYFPYLAIDQNANIFKTFLRITW